MDVFECINSQCGTGSDCGCAAKLRAELERLRTDLDDCAQARAGWKKFCEAENQAEIERLQKLVNLRTVAEAWGKPEIERLRALLQALHDWYVEYARINNLHNGDGTPATFHELLQARAALTGKPQEEADE